MGGDEESLGNISHPHMGSKCATCSPCAHGCEPMQWPYCSRFNPPCKANSLNKPQREGRREQGDVEGTGCCSGPRGATLPQLEEGSPSSEPQGYRTESFPGRTVPWLKFRQQTALEEPELICFSFSSRFCSFAESIPTGLLQQSVNWK